MDAQKFVGLSEDAARKMAQEAGLSVHVNTQVATMLTNSMQLDRLTLQVVNGMVVNARIG